MIKTYSFLDESGFLVPSSNNQQILFGLGLIKYFNPFDVNQKLHRLHEKLCTDLRKDDTRIEFSFKGITEKTLPTTLDALNILQEDSNWEFDCIYFDIQDPKFNAPTNASARWAMYISNIKLLIEKNLWQNEETILIADFLRKPKASNKRFEYIMTDVPQVYVLQVISHGVLMVQMADVLLGGFLYSEKDAGDQEGYKTRISQKVLEIQKHVGKDRFNTWKRDWGKSSRQKGYKCNLCPSAKSN